MMRRRQQYGNLAIGLVLLLTHLGAGSAFSHEHTLPAYVASLDSQSGSTDRESNPATDCRLTIRLREQATDRPLCGLLRVNLPDGQVLQLPELLNRGSGLRQSHLARQWHVVLESATVTVPRGRLVIEAVAGLEREAAREVVDLTNLADYDLTLPLTRFHHAADAHWRNGNTHLHLRSLTREGADEYLQSISRADNLELVFVSYLSRAKVNHTYISNTYTEDSLEQLSGDGVIFDWAEEHRHNFGPGGEGFGHVMFLDTKRLFEPVSIGPGITDQGTDWPPIRSGIDQARGDAATIVWCHNTLGYEDVPDWIAGVVDAQNVFDGGSEGDYENSFYRYMNVGMRVPFSTGTDWFLYDFARVYVETKAPLTVASWLNALEEGRTFITNGPMLSLDVAGYGPGDVIQLQRPDEVKVVGRVVGRHDFQTIELVHNGRVVAAADSRPVGGHFEGEMTFILPIKEPGWVALRIKSDEQNELGGELFGHTSAVYFELAGQTIFQRETAQSLIVEMREAMEKIQEQATFADDSQREEVLDIYRQGIATMRRRLAP